MPAELPICLACGSQYDWGNGTVPFRCKICDVRRNQYISSLFRRTDQWPFPGSSSIRTADRAAMDELVKSQKQLFQQMQAESLESEHLPPLDRTKGTLAMYLHRVYSNDLMTDSGSLPLAKRLSFSGRHMATSCGISSPCLMSRCANL